MDTKLLIPIVAAALLLLAAAIAVPPVVAQAAEPAIAVSGAASAGATATPRARIAGRRARLALAIQNNPSIAVVANLRAIERVYRHEGRTEELPSFYRGVLERSSDPLVRNFIHYRVARLEMREGDAKGALDALMRNLDENLGRPLAR